MEDESYAHPPRRGVSAELSTAACPDEDALLELVEGEGDPATAGHVRMCPSCQRALALCMHSASRATDADLSDDALVHWVERQQARRVAELPVGAKVERYAIVRRVGEGGMGVVYAAHDPELDRPVAIKVMHRTSSEPGDENRRLLREARALAKVSHPNVVPVFDLGTVESRVFLVMELVEGTTLREWLVSRRTDEAIIDAFIQAGRGLSAAHAAGLVHRDFKQENVLLGDDGRVRVTDFGLARSAKPAPDDSRLTVSAAVVGTPSYMAPEVQRGDEADAQSDQFSFGVALYRAFAGHAPRPDLPLATDGGAVPRRLRKVLRRALRLEPTARFSSMDALVSELERCRPRQLEPKTLLALGGVVTILGALAYGVLRSPPSLEGAVAPALPAAGDAASRAAPEIEPPPVDPPPNAPPRAETAATPVARTAAPIEPQPAMAIQPAKSLPSSAPAPAATSIPSSSSGDQAPPPTDPLSEF